MTEKPTTVRSSEHDFPQYRSKVRGLCSRAPRRAHSRPETRPEAPETRPEAPEPVAGIGRTRPDEPAAYVCGTAFDRPVTLLGCLGIVGIVLIVACLLAETAALMIVGPVLITVVWIGGRLPLRPATAAAPHEQPVTEPESDAGAPADRDDPAVWAGLTDLEGPGALGHRNVVDGLDGLAAVSDWSDSCVFSGPSGSLTGLEGFGLSGEAARSEALAGVGGRLTGSRDPDGLDDPQDFAWFGAADEFSGGAGGVRGADGRAAAGANGLGVAGSWNAVDLGGRGGADGLGNGGDVEAASPDRSGSASLDEELRGLGAAVHQGSRGRGRSDGVAGAEGFGRPVSGGSGGAGAGAGGVGVGGSGGSGGLGGGRDMGGFGGKGARRGLGQGRSGAWAWDGSDRQGTAAGLGGLGNARWPGRKERRSMNFWQSLSEPERDALLSVGTLRTFAGGSVLIREGEPADHVIVILGGWTKICVHQSGMERIIAERGPGQLLGERAALQVSVRSASVVALDAVRALVMRTEDFAGFIGAHPHVLEIVESQLYDRLTEYEGSRIPASFQPPAVPAAGRSWRQVERPERPERPEWPGRPERLGRPGFDGENCTVVFADVAGFGAHARTDEDRAFVRASLLEIMQEAFEAVPGGLAGSHVEDRGDGFLIIVPPQVPTGAVMGTLPHRLTVALERHNRRAGEPVRIQLRLAVHVGPVTSDAMGVSGSAIIHTARILESDVLKRRLAEVGACLGVIASAFVYDHIVAHSADAQRVGEFEKVRCKVKESRVDAWMALSGRARPTAGQA